MITISNVLSVTRAPLALLFLQENPTIRLLAVLLAMITDSIDGYFARRSRSVSRFGAILDPAMDKFFVYFALSVLFLEGNIEPFELMAMLARDFALCLYGVAMLAMGRWKSIVFRAIRWGKITTTLQFLILMTFIIGLSLPWYIFATLIVMGWLALLELFQFPQRISPAQM